jgi:hypothetical protein
VIPADLLWPKRPWEQVQCFFIRIEETADRVKMFDAVARSLRSMRFRDFGTMVLRAPAEGPWFVVDWVGLFEMSDELMRTVSADLKTEVVGLGVTVAHGRPADHVHLHRFRSGDAIPGHLAQAQDDDVASVGGNPLRLPSSVALDELGSVADTLRFPDASQTSAPRLEIRCVPGRLLFWAIVLLSGAAAVLIFI